MEWGMWIHKAMHLHYHKQTCVSSFISITFYEFDIWVLMEVNEEKHVFRIEMQS